MNKEKDFPESIVNLIKALSSRPRRHILISLMKYGRLSYSEIRKQTRLDEGTLSYNLKKLLECNLVKSFPQSENSSIYTSYFELSEFGRRFIEGLLNVFASF